MMESDEYIDSEAENGDFEDYKKHVEMYPKHYALKRASLTADVETFKKYYSADSDRGDTVVEWIGRKNYDPKLFPNFVEIAKIVVNGNKPFSDTWFITPHAVACCVGNIQSRDYLESVLLKPHETPEGYVLISLEYTNKLSLQDYFQQGRFLGAVYRNDQREIEELCSDELLKTLEVPYWVYYTAVLRGNSFVTNLLRSRVALFTTEYTSAKRILKYFARFDAQGCIYRDDMEGFLKVIKQMKSKDIEHIFSEIISPDFVNGLHPVISEYFPNFNMPMRFYLYYVRHFGKDIFIDHVYKYAMKESKLKPVKSKHIELIAYLKSTYPPPVYELGLWKMAVELNDLDLVAANLRYFSLEDILYRLKHVENVEMMKLIVPHLHVADMRPTDKGWKRLKGGSGQRGATKLNGEKRYRWMIEYFNKWKTEMQPVLLTLACCLGLEMRDVFPIVEYFYKKAVVEETLECDYCKDHCTKLDECDYCKFNYCEHSSIEEGRCSKCKHCKHGHMISVCCDSDCW